MIILGTKYLAVAGDKPQLERAVSFFVFRSFVVLPACLNQDDEVEVELARSSCLWISPTFPHWPPPANQIAQLPASQLFLSKAPPQPARAPDLDLDGSCLQLSHTHAHQNS